ncbi:MAG: DNA-directed RNA polymerase subunit beta', partial [Abditibacteriota bacterium]|nr:DNA-directed RNA polymerase subunit beta' [Abditibacteriota bacterium]
MIDSTQFKLIKIGIASPEDVVEWARGPQNEVTKPETIQYSSFKPVPDGLFCERIFGPTKDYECHCKRYKKIKYKGQTCPQCHVDITTSKVRRERMGYIKLMAPVSHIWYLKTVPSPISLLLDLPPKNLEHVLYYREYMVTHADTDKIKEILPVVNKAIAEFEKRAQEEKAEDLKELDQYFEERAREEGDTDKEKRETEHAEQRKAFEEFHNKKISDLEKGRDILETKRERDVIESDDFGYFKKLRDQVISKELMKDEAVDLYKYFNADIGAEAVKTLLKKLNLKELKDTLLQEIKSAPGSSKQVRNIKRLEVIDSFLESGSKPEWMILENIPVIPPDLRPMVQLDGGRFATSDLNDLYRRVINRNNTLKKIVAAKAPQIMVNHQKNLIQEAVDALIDNDRKQRKVNGSNGRALKSLSDMLKGKEGRFRKNLLGKRVDYSGRSVIVVGPSLKIYPCGLPKEMALELVKPVGMKEMVKKGLVSNIKL